MNVKANRKVLIFGFVVFVFIIWIIQNPIGKFGYHGFGYTVYSAIPIPYFDLKIGPEGIPQIREKSHFVSFNEVNEYIGSLRQDYDITLIIGTGYEDMVNIDEKILESNSNVIVLKTPEAIEKYNELKDEGRKVAIILHSTC
ncbi:MAG: MTH938/NDUFAF3 family protein [Candidatus Bathyarchaeota archaeon]|nr:MTH938/NDUFAF3 family protein [Candidatus Bathyarchaeota archaeon]